MYAAASAFYWLRFGIALVMIALAIIAAVRRGKPKSASRDLVLGVVGLLVVAIASYLAAPAANWVASGVCVALGLVLGFALAKPRALTAWLAALAMVFAAVMVLFGEPIAYGFGLAALALGAALPLGQGIRANMTKHPATAGAG